MKEKHTYRFYVDRHGYYLFRSFKVYWAYRQLIREEISKFDWEQSFSGQFLSNGFKQKFPKKIELLPTDNWFGCSLYYPDYILEKGDKTIHLSLQGFLIPHSDFLEAIEKHKELVENGSIKYIRMDHKGKTIYKDFTGNLPSKELVNKFIYE